MAIRIKLWADYGSYPLWGVDEIDIAIPIVVRYRVLGFEDSGFGIQELRFWCTS